MPLVVIWGESVLTRSGLPQRHPSSHTIATSNYAVGADTDRSYAGESILVLPNMKPPVLPQRSEAKALWGLCWRMMLLAPVGIFGVVALFGVVCLTIGAPMYAAALAISGDYLWAVVTLIGWGMWLRLGGPARRFVFEGWEHGSL